VKRLRDQTINPDQIRRFLESAEKKLKDAHRVAAINSETSFQMAYESMLRAALGLMLRHGKRPRSLPGHHVAIIEFAGGVLGEDFRGLIRHFDQMRRKRNDLLYEADDFVSETEVVESLKIAEKFLAQIKKILKE
jgi:uncharacterized protein (UPF0332 family)